MAANKMSKAELLREMEYSRLKIKTAKDVTARERYRTRYKMARKHFYECNLCADALTETYIDARGEEKERFIRDCGLSVCPYHDYFVDLANGVEDDVTKGLKIFLSRY
jgi:hypothetical protein